MKKPHDAELGTLCTPEKIRPVTDGVHAHGMSALLDGELFVQTMRTAVSS